MRIERLVIEAGDSTLQLDLHPRLTVVAGMGEIERASLLGEVIGALAGSRSGVHVEVEERSGRHLAVFRPATGRARVVDVDAARDVTAELQDPSGSCDLLQRLGLDRASARQVMRLGPADLATSTDHSEAIEVLAGLDQKRVWSAADALQRAEGDLTSEAEAIGSGPEDAAMIEEVEARHLAVERAADTVESTRKRTFWIGGIAATATVPATALAGRAGLGLLAIAALSVTMSLAARLRLTRAARAEERALADAGAASYLGFQLQRVNGLLGDDSNRKALMDVAAARRQAQVDWQRVAGDIPLAWALANRAEIEAAAGLRREVDALATISQSAPDLPHDVTAELAQALVARVAHARAVAGEGLPLILDEPFIDLEPTVKPMLLELLGRSSGDPQIVILTDDEDVASWARLEALTGEVRLLEPQPVHEAAEGDPEVTQHITL